VSKLIESEGLVRTVGAVIESINPYD